MSDTLEYIDSYFTMQLNDSERQEFEARCSSDESFAADVAFYVTARQTVRETLLRQKQEQWKPAREAVVMKPVKKAVVLKWIPYAAAACIIFVIAGYFLFYKPTPERLASAYLNHADLSQTMDASHDSIQTGISNYKNGNYKEALIFFEDVRKRDSKNSDAKKYAGQTYLKMNDYDNALQRFGELSVMQGLYSNSGDIFQATTLLRRDKAGDKEAAKLLLEKVVRENEEGNKEAKEMLATW